MRPYPETNALDIIGALLVNCINYKELGEEEETKARTQMATLDNVG